MANAAIVNILIVGYLQDCWITFNIWIVMQILKWPLETDSTLYWDNICICIGYIGTIGKL